MSTLVDVQAAATRLKVSEQRIRTLCRNKTLAAKKYGGSWVVEEQSLVSFLAMRNGKSTKDSSEKRSIRSTQKKRTGPIALSFFSGAMGLDLGLEAAGFNIPLACEVDRFCRQTIQLNRPEIPVLDDINKYTASDIRKAANLTPKQQIDLVVGGPPCQAFSTA